MTQAPDQALSLSELHFEIQQTLQDGFLGRGTWIIAEIARANEKNGHRYFELVESNQRTILAKAQATLWKGNYIRLHQNHGLEILQVLETGSEAMLFVQVEFHPVFGLKLNITDVSLEFAYGQLERLKKATIQRLADEDIIHENKALALPIVLQKIVVIGASDSAGMADFVNQLQDNEYGYHFDIHVLNSAVQGQSAVSDLTRTLADVATLAPDVVAVVRGGGARLDLEVFNHYEVAKAVALCDVPVLVGIGHETDHSVVDVVANVSVKTPTACAQFIINHVAEFEYSIQHLTRQIARTSENLLQREERRVQHLGNQTHIHAQRIMAKEKQALTRFTTAVYQQVKVRVNLPLAELEQLRIKLGEQGAVRQISNERINLMRAEDRLQLGVRHALQEERSRLAAMENVIENQDPALRLKSGYGINRINGNLITDLSKISVGDEMITVINLGQITSRIENIDHE